MSRLNPLSFRTFATTALLAATFGAGPSTADVSGLGRVDFDTSCSADAQAEFDDGITLLHHMMYLQAEAAFGRAAAVDPACAMAQWGIGMANFHPLWAGQPTEDETAQGLAAATRAAALAPGSDREAAYLDAMRAFYDAAPAGYRAQLAAWADAQRAVFDRFPEDVDAGAFAALARLATAPRDPGFTEQRAVGGLLEELHARAPRHPGVYHYAIHAYDHQPLAELGLPFARGYEDMAPEVPHALHMPSHIFTRLGYWEEAAAWNRRSAAAALTMPAGDATSVHYPHAIDYGVYATLQLGDRAGAEAQVAALLGQARIQDNFGSAYALSAAPGRLALEQEDWPRAAALPVVPHDSLSWEAYPQTRANIWLAKGIGAARSGDAQAARAAEASLAELHAALAERGGYWAELVDAQRQTVAAWAALADGDSEAALALMRDAADQEDRLGKSGVTPGHVLPARELLGDMLAELGRVGEARVAYEATLASTPGRRRSLEALATLRDG